MTEKTVNTSLTLYERHHAKLAELAEKFGVSKSRIMQDLIDAAEVVTEARETVKATLTNANASCG